MSPAGGVFVAALLLSSAPGVSLGADAVSGASRPAPVLCSPATPACSAERWRSLLAATRQAELSAPAGDLGFRIIVLPGAETCRNGFPATSVTRIDIRARGGGSALVQSCGVDRRWRLSTAEAQAFRSRFNALRFDRLEPGPTNSCLDGSDWLIEAADGDRYRLLQVDCGAPAALAPVMAWMKDVLVWGTRRP